MNKIPFNDMLAIAHALFMTSDRCSLRYDNDDYDFEKITGYPQPLGSRNVIIDYTYEEVRAFYPDLPYSLTYWNQHELFSTAGYCAMDALRATMRHWASPAMTVTTIPVFEDRFLTTGYIEDINAIFEIKEIIHTVPGGYHVKGDGVHLVSVKGDLGQRVEVTGDICSWEEPLPRSWFEQHFPGCTTHIDVALGLGLAPQDVVAYALKTVAQLETGAYPTLAPATLPVLI